MDRQRPRLWITLDPDFELVIRPDQFGPCQRFETQPVQRVRSIRNQFS
jgi:hypothetical protein